MKRFLQGLCAFCALFAANSYADGHLKVTLSQPTQRSDQQLGKVVLTLINDGDRQLDVLKWTTPFVSTKGRLPNDLFEIKDAQGRDVPYVGERVKFVGMTAESFIHLEPGQSVTTMVDLGKDYALTNGPYTVQYNQDVTPIDLTDTAAHPRPVRKREIAHSNVLEIWVNGSLLNATSLLLKAKNSAAETAAVTCSSSDASSQMAAARTAANQLISQAVTYLQNHTDSANTFTPTDRYKWWFGDDGVVTQQQLWDAQAGGYNDPHVSPYARIYDMSNVPDIDLLCDPCDGWSASAAAHANTSQPFQVYLCPHWFDLQLTGADSKPGVLLHELSHFAFGYASQPLKGTVDKVYGQSQSHALSISDFSQARQNADNFEYFFENPGTQQ